MKPKTLPLLPMIILIVLLPLILQCIVYGGFTTNYSGKCFSFDLFDAQYNSGISRYRLLGPALVRMVSNLLGDCSWCRGLNAWNRNILEYSEIFDYKLYASIFIVNLTGFIGTQLALLIILKEKLAAEGDRGIAIAILSASAMIIALSQFTVVPYDTWSYFFIILNLSLWKRTNIGFLICSALLMCLSTMTRESSALVLSACFAHLLINHKSYCLKSAILQLSILTSIFGGTYIALRIYLGTESRLFQEDMLFYNLLNMNFLSWIGLATFGCIITIIYSIFTTANARKTYLLFILFSFPYLMLVLLAGIFFEIRLYVPLYFIGIIFYIWEKGSDNDKHITPMFLF